MHLCEVCEHLEPFALLELKGITLIEIKGNGLYSYNWVTFDKFDVPFSFYLEDYSLKG